MKVRITTLLTATAAITFLTMRTLTSTAAQQAIAYPLDVTTLTITGLVVGSDITILAAGTETVLDTREDNTSNSYGYTYETPQVIDIAVYKPGYIPAFIRNYSLGSSNASLPITQTPDASYL